MDIKEIALKVAQATNLHYIVTSERHTNDDWNIRFAEALIAELAKQNEPVAWAIYVTGDLCDVFQNKDFALLEFNRRNQLYPEPSREFRGLYTIPPTAKQIANETAWQPIETAPKDGLIYIWITGINKHGQKWSNTEGECWPYCYYDNICGEWRTTRPSGHLRCVPERFVTHWMPLPTPPKQSMEGV